MSALNKASGGPAFPYAFQHEDSSHFTSQGFAPGMSLRDWFAGQAMDGDVDYWRRHLAPPMNSREHAKFAHADAMLAARTKGAAS